MFQKKNTVSMRNNNHKAIMRGYLEDSKNAVKRVPDWKLRQNEIKALEKKIGFESDNEPKGLSMVWKVSPDSYTALDEQILAERKAAQAKLETENGIRISNEEEEEIQRLETEVAQAEFRAETLEADYLRKTGVLPF